MKTDRFFLYLLLGFFGLFAQAQASIIFDFGGGSDDQHSLSVMDTTNTHNIVVTAFKADDSQALIHRNSNGWGVSGDPGNNRMDNGEYLVFSLAPQSLRLLGGVFLDHRGGIEQFDLFVDSLKVLDNVSIPNASGTTKQYIDLTIIAADPADLYGSEFKFVGGAGSGTRISQLVFVPEPGILALMGLGLAGIGFARKKKQI